MTDTQTIITMAVLFAGIVYVTAMYIYRKATAGETFNLESYAQTFGYVAIVAIVAYITTGVLPDFNALLTQILASFPDSGTVLAGVSTIIIYLFDQGTKSVSATSTTNAAATTASTTNAAATTASTSTTTFDPGFTVTPTSLSVKSGTAITLNVVTGVATTILTIDWLDGVIETIPLTVTSAGKVASPSHTYTFVQDRILITPATPSIRSSPCQTAPSRRYSTTWQTGREQPARSLFQSKSPLFSQQTFITTLL